MIHLHQTNSSSAGSQIHLTTGASGQGIADGSIIAQWTDNNLYINNRENGNIQFYTNGGSRARIDSDGLKFGTDTAATNALDDYEEGTWTPVMASTNGGNFNGSYNQASGRYTKIGRFCHCRLDVTWSNANNRSGSILITGLPFTNYGNGSTGGYGAPQWRDLSGMNSDIRKFGNSSWLEDQGTRIYMMAYNSSGTEYYVSANSSGRITGEFIIYTN